MKKKQLLVILIVTLIIIAGILLFLNFKKRTTIFSSEKNSTLTAREQINQNVTNSYSPNTVEIDNNESNSKKSNLIFDRSPENVQIKVINDTISENGVTIVITDNNKTPYNWGENYKIEQKNNDIWEEIKPNKKVIVHSVAYNVDENNQITCRINWNEYYGTLEKGIYRIVKAVGDTDTNIYSDEFEIQ